MATCIYLLGSEAADQRDGTGCMGEGDWLTSLWDADGVDRGRRGEQQCSALAYIHIVVWVMARIPGLQLRPLIRALS